MSDREDRKLREVPVASYQYRHEAEFAAGFLKDAGIPYRLQIDDPALGISMSTSAVIWVAAIDEERARDILDDERALEPRQEEVDTLPGASRRPMTAGAGRPAAGPESSPVEGSAPVVPHGDKPKPDLTLRQRMISLGGSVAVASTLGLEAVRQAGVAVAVVLAVIAAALSLVAMYGRAPGFLARMLAALSGDAP